MRHARSAGQLPIRAQSGNSARPITGQQQQQQLLSSQRYVQSMLTFACVDEVYLLIRPKDTNQDTVVISTVVVFGRSQYIV